ncbi:unannotated protein [freshwater metagenome]|uniref:Unannotated protein n=1 Tax=freshwater metagenome TaxID=449393 RepID=A0A6J6SFH2_9ZZZZ
MRITEFSRDGLTFDVLDEGPEDGDPVVLLHGFPERATVWRDVAPLLHAAGLRTYALDLRGYSPRARPRGRRQYRLSLLAGDVAALIDRIGAPVHLVGHDWGAIIGWRVAGEHPDRLRSWTAVSVPHLRAYFRSTLRSTQGLKSWYILLFQLPFLMEAVLGLAPGVFLFAMRRGGMSGEEVQRCRREFLEAGALPGALGMYRALPLMGRASRTDVRVPTTMVWSDDDIALGRLGVELTAEHVHADYEFVELPGVTHWIPTQAPEALAAAIVRRASST